MRKKILFVITKSNFGGAQRYVHELATAMQARGHIVAVAHGGNGILVQKLRAAGIETYEIKSFERDINIKKEWASLFELLRVYRAYEPDVVHLNSSKAGGSGALMARIAGIPKIIYTAHGWAFWEPRPFLARSIIWFLSWMTALLCHKIIMVSEYEYQKTALPFTKHKFEVIHTAVPSIDFKSRETARDALFSKDDQEAHTNDLWLATNAELTHNKNLFRAIDAVATLNQTSPQSIFYTIVGSGELREKLQLHINDREAASHIQLLGYIDDARSYLKAFDMFMLPSIKEGMPYAILEAGAAGLPVIASKVGGIPETIDHEKNGLLIDPSDTNSIVSALQKYAASEVLRLEYGTLLCEKIERNFALTDMIEKTAVLYQTNAT